MKKTIIRIILALAVLSASGAAPVLADTFPVPACSPGPCPQ
jgi:hypothetical protein